MLQCCGGLCGGWLHVDVAGFVVAVSGMSNGTALVAVITYIAVEGIN